MEDIQMIRVLLDFIVLVGIVCMLFVSLVMGEPVFFTLAIFGGLYMGYELLKDLRNTSQ